MPEAALALGDMAARTPASRDKAANEKVVQSALSWYQAAANAGVPSAQFKLANAYFAGVGVPRDPAQALLWYGRAAQQGLPQAQHAIGIMLIGGVAGTADPVEGYKWLLLAEQGGHPRFPRRAGKGGGADCRSATASAPRRWRSASCRPPNVRSTTARRRAPICRGPRPTAKPTMSMLSVARQARPEVTLAVCRGACRLMRQAGHSVLIEVPLPDGRRADIFAVGRGGEITIVEVKSSIEDWRVDIKWPDYLDWCDQLYVAVPVDFPQALIPAEIGLIVADSYGGEILRHRAAPAGGGGAPQVAADRLRAPGLRTARPAGRSRLRRYRLGAGPLTPASPGQRHGPTSRRRPGRGWPRPCGCAHRP